MGGRYNRVSIDGPFDEQDDPSRYVESRQNLKKSFQFKIIWEKARILIYCRKIWMATSVVMMTIY